MAKKRRGRFTWKEDRQLIQMATASATLEETAATFRTSIETVEKKAEMLGLALKERDGQKRFVGSSTNLGLKAKG